MFSLARRTRVVTRLCSSAAFHPAGRAAAVAASASRAARMQTARAIALLPVGLVAPVISLLRAI
jgi:hypothetical protein